ncbi:gliding motility lipoprotein GldH [Flavobacterium sp. JP2137]|uniref:gliding motility lipoprotein GldH n=1 Tax=Flavobacterium sp. JP2137 TaxID=3414510 RepID=UPI003D2F9D2A
MRLRNKTLFAAVALLGVLTSCDKKSVFDEFQTVGTAWNKDDIKTFVVEQQDSLNPHNLFLNVRNNNKYPFNNLFVIVKMEQPDKQVVVDTLEFQMARADGTLLGTGFTDIKESKLWLKEGFTFKQAGTYTFQVQQAVRESGKVDGVQELEGISEIGLRIEKAE